MAAAVNPPPIQPKMEQQLKLKESASTSTSTQAPQPDPKFPPRPGFGNWGEEVIAKANHFFMDIKGINLSHYHVSQNHLIIRLYYYLIYYVLMYNYWP